MPNWCSTSYAIDGEESKDLYKVMKDLEEGKLPVAEKPSDNRWLGNLVNYLGGDSSKIFCRGWWEGLSYDEDRGVLSFYTESAWAPAYETFDLVQDKFPSLNIYYIAIEEGLGLYETNDSEGKYFTERYYLDMLYDRYQWDTIEEAALDISKLVGRDVKPDEIDEALDEYESKQEDPDFYCVFHSIDIV